MKLFNIYFIYLFCFLTCSDIGGKFHGVSSSAELSTFFDVGGIIGKLT